MLKKDSDRNDENHKPNHYILEKCLEMIKFSNPQLQEYDLKAIYR